MATIYLGKQTKVPLSFCIRDFPKTRKTALWKDFPTTLHLPSQEILEPFITTPFSYPEVVSISYTPEYSEWERVIALFKQRDDLKKVVLSRIKTITFKEAISVKALYLHIKEKNKHGTPFAILLDEHTGFLGVTPEMLYQREELRLLTEALAGTRLSVNQDELLTSLKNLEEFEIVKQEIYQKLQRIAQPFPYNESVFLKQANGLSHLHFPFEALLKKPLSDSKLISLLHPTPAIGGLPKEATLQFLEQYEMHDRGWYAGTIEALSERSSNVYVAIRSALIQENKMHIFTGAGILKNSDPKTEWVEIENKTKIFEGYEQTFRKSE